VPGLDATVETLTTSPPGSVGILSSSSTVPS
jgi:hypothetical protein